MLKKMALSALLALSTIVSAQINLDLDLIISDTITERHATGSVVIDENVVTSIVFNSLESLIITVIAQEYEEAVTIQAQFFQKMEDDSLVPMTDEPLTVQASSNEPGTITINEPDNNGSLVLVITPSLVE